MDDILIDGRKYLAVIRVKVAHKNTLPKHPLEDGSSTTDNIIIGMPTFDLTLELFPGEYQSLLDLAKQKRLITVVLPQGSYKNVAVSAISDEYGTSSNTTSCTLTLTQQRIVRTERRPTEIDGITTAASEELLSGTYTKSTILCPNDTTVEQMKQHRLSKLSAKEKAAEEERMNGMSTYDLWTYLVPEAEQIRDDSELGQLIKYDAERPRARVDIDIHRMGVSAGGSQFTHNGTSYKITTRAETTGGETVRHAEVIRSRDNATVYMGVFEDMTPVEMKDPDTGQTLAVLQSNNAARRVYIE